MSRLSKLVAQHFRDDMDITEALGSNRNWSIISRTISPTRASFLSFVILVGLLGCDRPRASGQEKTFENTALDTTLQKNTNSSNDSLFKGKSITIIEGGPEALIKARPEESSGSCLDGVDEKVKKKLSSLNYGENIAYSEFESRQNYNTGPDKFVLRMPKALFSRIGERDLKKLDQYAGFTITRNLYLLEKGSSSYMLLIGPESASSGLGHLYRSHLLVPLDPNRPLVEFESISDDPRRIFIDNSGSIHYTQVDSPNSGAIRKSPSKSIRLSVSLFTLDSTMEKKLEDKFVISCENVEDIYLKK